MRRTFIGLMSLGVATVFFAGLSDPAQADNDCDDDDACCAPVCAPAFAPCAPACAPCAPACAPVTTACCDPCATGYAYSGHRRGFFGRMFGHRRYDACCTTVSYGGGGVIYSGGAYSGGTYSGGAAAGAAPAPANGSAAGQPPAPVPPPPPNGTN